MNRRWYEIRILEVLSATARPVVLKPVITPSTKKAHRTSPPIRAFQPTAALFFFFLTTAPHHHNRPEPLRQSTLVHQSPTSLILPITD
jgi:hypothetical protein